MHIIDRWHEMLAEKDFDGLNDILAEDAVMYSPVVYTPQKGKMITRMYLEAAGHVIGNEHFKYTKKIIGESDACLEFETEIDGMYVNGIDLISWNEEQQITEFKVMIRPLKAVNAVWQGMGRRLEEMKKG